MGIDKMTEKNSLLKTLAIGMFSILAIWLLSNSSLFEKEPDLSQLSFEERHEAKLQSTVENLLEKFYSPKAFFVAVKVESPDYKETESIQLDPQHIKSKRTEDYDGNLGDVFNNRPSFGALKKLQEKDLDLPGLVDQTAAKPTNRLPGFPSMDELAANPKLADELLPAAESEDGKPEFSVSKEDEQVYYNQTTERMAQSKTKVEKISIQIVIDDTSSKLREVSANDLELFIKNSIGFKLSRQDSINIEYESFEGTYFVFQRFLFRHRAAISQLQSFFIKYDIYIILVCLFWLTLVACTGLIKAYFRKRKEERLKREAEKREEEARQRKEIIRKKQELKEKRTALSVIAQTKPQALAHTILGLLNAPEKKGKKDE